MRKPMSLFVLVMLITSAIDSIRNLPAVALFGPSLLFFLSVAAIVFLIPTALVSAELSATSPAKGGIYYWVREALGPRFGCLAIWLQWINTMVWYPSILSFIAGTLSYVIDPAFATNKFYLVPVILIVFWGMTLINLMGVYVSAMFATFCTLVGFVLPVLFIIVLGIVWALQGHPSAIHLTMQTVWPSVHGSGTWMSLTAIIASFLGMELASVHVMHVKNPQKYFPRALFVSVILILVTMAFGAIAIAIVLPATHISLVSGVMEAFTAFFKAEGLSWMIPVIVVMLLLGSLGGMVNWIISPAKGLLQAASHGYLPPFLAKENAFGVCSNLLLLQAILVSLICLVFLLMPSVNGSYWFLTDLSTELYLLMYMLLFIAAFVLKQKWRGLHAAFVIPGKKFGMALVCLLGLLGSVLTFIVGFLPPSGVDVGEHFAWHVGVGVVLMMAPVLLCFLYEAMKNKRTG